MYWKATHIHIDPETGNLVPETEVFHNFELLLQAAASFNPFPYVPRTIIDQIANGATMGTYALDMSEPLTLVPFIPPGTREHIEMEHPDQLETFEMIVGSYIQVEPQDVPAKT